MLGYGIKETTTTTGTGTLTLSAVTGFPRFANVFGVGDLVEYSLLTSAGLPIECGIGTVSASNTLARTYPLVTWDGTTYDNTAPTAISLTGTTTVICTGSPGSSAPFIQSMSTSATNKALNSAHMSTNNTITAAVTANMLYVHPFQLIANRPLAGLICRVSSGSGTSATLGLYRCGASGLPTDLLQSGIISIAAAGVKTIAFSAWYPPGWYFMACVADNGSVIFNGVGAVPGASPLGTDGNNQNITALTVANGSITLPNPFSGTTSNLVNSSTFPCVGVLLG